ncbi:hypothetical protein KW794_02940 [Candidatus Saccharibacteria bacterium]|nr:hypothetical protein [Candidatus Saccharibacteria bacterium]
MPDESRVFDVSKPNKVSPTPTSRPVIVGHHPMNDPMVREQGDFGSEAAAPPTKIPVSDGEDGVTVEQAMEAHQAADTATQGSPAVFSDPPEEPSPPPFTPELTHPSESIGEGPFTAVEPPHNPQPDSELPAPSEPHESHITGLSLADPKPKRRGLKWVLIGLMVLLITVYLVIDSGVINTGFKLPFHVFKQKTETPATSSSPNSNQPATTGPTLPDGFKEYKLSGTNLTFAAPLSWGNPTSTTDPGYSQRGGANQADGVFAYLVNFATNKDIQIAVTSNKYLPAVRAPLYYDYLQWCIGSNDQKIYQSILNFSTTSKIDTPTTITCNQGPITASPIDNTSIVQLKATDAGSKVIGDVYTMNLKDPALVVFRVKDTAMTSGTDIKQLLITVKLTTTPSDATSGQ